MILEITNLKKMRGDTVAMEDAMISRTKPKAASIKINVDGAAQISRRHAGVGYVARDSNRRWLLREARNVGQMSSTTAELLAIFLLGFDEH